MHKKYCLAVLLFVGALVEAEEKPKPEFIQYHNRVIIFAPFHQGYERIKPNAYYVGGEVYFIPLLNQESSNTLLDAELRMGYNFFYKGKDHITPFAGIGYIEDFHKHHHHTRHTPGVLYGTVGFLYTHEFNKLFNLGFNAKVLLGGAVSKKEYWGTPVYGIDVSLPITFRFGYRRHWDYRLEPFNTYLHGPHATQDFLGFRNSLAYRF